MQQIDLEVIKRFDPLALSPLIEDRSDVYFGIKRAIDLILSTILLVILSPIMLLIAIVIKIDSRGPAIFSQVRIGSRRWVHDRYSYWKRSEFTIYKFRTMYTNADHTVHEKYITSFVNGDVEASEDIPIKYKLCNDARVTRVGHFLRKTSLDELPQFWNVIIGDMSLVGPRPDVPYAMEYYKPWHFDRLSALPGLTGLWQVKGRSSVCFDEMARLDIEYVRNQSLALDIKILFMTIPAVLSTKGAV